MLQTCRFYPSCSVYAMEAIEKKGWLFGIAVSIGRILRCNKFSNGGYDPVTPCRERISIVGYSCSVVDTKDAGGD